LTRIASMEEKAWFQALLTGREKLNLFVPLTGSCQFVRSKVLKELGGWDETALAEDVELALRLVEKSYLVKYAPDVCSWQETPSGFGDLIRQRGRWYRGYMEAALKYGRLLDRINKKTIDAELTLVGPYMMVLCLISYVNWAVSVLFFPQISLLSNFAAIVVALTTVSLLSVGTALIFGDKPARVRNVLWIPFVYLYWIMQIGIAGWAFLQILFRRRRIWRKTVKKGFTTSTFA
jgi:cellulose synthase/poly-beta-1,6-N-acetylglucosamine synthase-like glycosyltransferase